MTGEDHKSIVARLAAVTGALFAAVMIGMRLIVTSGKLIADLIKQVEELRAVVDDVQAQNAGQERRIRTLEAELAKARDENTALKHERNKAICMVELLRALLERHGIVIDPPPLLAPKPVPEPGIPL